MFAQTSHRCCLRAICAVLIVVVFSPTRDVLADVPANDVDSEYAYYAQQYPSQASVSDGYDAYSDEFDPGGLSLDHSLSIENFQATFHVHSVTSGFDPIHDGDWGVQESPYASLSVSGSDAGFASQSSNIRATKHFSLIAEPLLEVPTVIHTVRGHLAPGDSISFDGGYFLDFGPYFPPFYPPPISDGLGIGGYTEGGINETITSPGDFHFTFSVPRSGIKFRTHSGHVTYYVHYDLRIDRAAGEHEASYVEFLDPPFAGLNGVVARSVPEPRTSIMCLGMLICISARLRFSAAREVRQAFPASAAMASSIG
jgi:hypothetical protein